MSDVLELLKQKNIEFIPNGKDVKIRCLNPEHEDKDPSLRVHCDTGVFNCFSCGFKGDIFSVFNKYRNPHSARVRSFKDKVKALRDAASPGLEFPSDAFFDTNESIGQVSNEVCRKFQAFKSPSLDRGNPDRLWFPVYDPLGRIVVFNGRQLYGNEGQRWTMSHSGVTVPLYPPPQKLDCSLGFIVLVEGMSDMLTLYMQGIRNVVCLFGAKSHAANTLYEKVQIYELAGIGNLYLLLDNDAAGKAATKQITEHLKQKTDLQIHNLTPDVLEEGKDPGSISLEGLNKLMKHLPECINRND